MVFTHFKINGYLLWMREKDGAGEEFQGYWQWVAVTLTFTLFLFKVCVYT